jgi:hypothetical protein
LAREESLVARLTEKQARSATEQLALLEELKGAAVLLGFEVREEKLLREVGYRVRSGSCRVREKHVILLDRGLSPSAQIDILVDELAGRPLEDVYLSPAARRLLERATPSQAKPVETPTADASPQAAR